MLALNLKWPYWARIPQWLAEPKNFWLFATGLLIACLMGDWSTQVLAPCASRQDKIRYAGWILDILGLTSIALGISSKLDRFMGKNLAQLARSRLYEWLGRFPLIRRDQVIHVGAAHIQLQPAAMEAYGKTKPNDDWPLARKVEWLVTKHDELTDRIQELAREARRNEKAIGKRIGEIESAFEHQIKDLQIDHADVEVGGIGKELVGLSWVFLGITFATIPEFIESTFPWLIGAFQAMGTGILSLLPAKQLPYLCQ